MPDVWAPYRVLQSYRLLSSDDTTITNDNVKRIEDRNVRNKNLYYYYDKLWQETTDTLSNINDYIPRGK